jgi:hypothetical protein
MPPVKPACESLITPEEAIRFLGLDRQGLRQPREALRWLCRTGRLRYTKVGRYVRFRQAWLEELVERASVNKKPRARPALARKHAKPGASSTS